MWRTFWALLVLGTIALVSLSFQTSCRHIGPIERCSGKSVNRNFVPGTTDPEDACTECIEATCCDLIGECQGTDCANQVASAHACVVDAGRSGAIQESSCRRTLANDQSKNLYQCMRDNCDTECKLPTCRLDPLVPRLGSEACDLCFAQGCCSLMNDCAKNRACLLALRCIVDECRDDLAEGLASEQVDAATERRMHVCDAGVEPADNDPDPRGRCFGRCIEEATRENDPQSFEAACLSVQIAECGAAVNCGRECGRPDGSAPPVSDASFDAAVDAPTDAGAD